MKYVGGGGGGGATNLECNFSPQTLTIETKLMLHILLKNLSVEKQMKNTSTSADITISMQGLIKKLVKMTRKKHCKTLITANPI